ncbi:MAG: UvrD-helicase domain-containing protein, partial [Corynebacterium sp.]|nr:UvrD-helicase domain-containing protein [Corynebacterium sp.]
MTTWTIIKASAGSGKTYRLTELLTERLRRVDADGTHPYRPSQIIATTFTRA